jgi:hypothetical protein
MESAMAPSPTGGGNAALSAEQPSKTAFHTYLNEKTTEL